MSLLSIIGAVVLVIAAVGVLGGVATVVIGLIAMRRGG